MFIYTTKSDLITGLLAIVAFFIGTYLAANGQMERHHFVAAIVGGTTMFFIIGFVQPYQKFKQKPKEIDETEVIDDQGS
ncbi:MAG: hypothetical protein ACPGWR_01990 [Ardenticatenaceae bacterium]